MYCVNVNASPHRQSDIDLCVSSSYTDKWITDANYASQWCAKNGFMCAMSGRIFVQIVKRSIAAINKAHRKKE